MAHIPHASAPQLKASDLSTDLGHWMYFPTVLKDSRHTLLSGDEVTAGQLEAFRNAEDSLGEWHFLNRTGKFS